MRRLELALECTKMGFLTHRHIDLADVALVHSSKLGSSPFADRTLNFIRTPVVLDCLRDEFDLRFDLDALGLGDRLGYLVVEFLKRVVQEKQMIMEGILHRGPDLAGIRAWGARSKGVLTRS